jgi:hypothetical protein
VHWILILIVSVQLGRLLGMALRKTNAVPARSEPRRAKPKVKVPDLYPALSPLQLEAVLDAEAFARVQRMPIVQVWPLHAEGARARQVGVALSRVMIRELQRTPGLSVRGPEDTPVEGSADPTAAHANAGLRQNVLGGSLRVDGERCSAQLWIARGDGRVERAEISADGIEALLLAWAVRALEWLDTARGQAFGAPPDVSWPRGADGFAQLGAVIEFAAAHPASDESFDVDDEVLALLRAGAQMSVAGTLLSSRHVVTKLELLQAYPEDAQLCVSLATDVWSGMGGDRDAFQFLRRALEISPGLGKAHMLAPSAATHPERMAAHAELGYALQPNGSLGSSSYLRWLSRWSRNPERAKQVALAEVARAPADPHNYYPLIDAYEATGDTRRALETAQQLMRYLAPLHARTRACFEQDATTREKIERGEWDPAGELRERMERLEEETKRGKSAA